MIKIKSLLSIFILSIACFSCQKNTADVALPSEKTATTKKIQQGIQAQKGQYTDDYSHTSYEQSQQTLTSQKRAQQMTSETKVLKDGKVYALNDFNQNDDFSNYAKMSVLKDSIEISQYTSFQECKNLIVVEN